MRTITSSVRQYNWRKMELLTLFFICSEHPCQNDTGTQNVHSLGCISAYVKAPCLQGLIYLGILTPTACLVFHVVNYKHIMAKMLRGFGTFPPVCKICHRATWRRKIGYLSLSLSHKYFLDLQWASMQSKYKNLKCAFIWLYLHICQSSLFAGPDLSWRFYLNCLPNAWFLCFKL